MFRRWRAVLTALVLAAPLMTGQIAQEALRAPSRVAPVPEFLRERGVVRIRAIELDSTLFDPAAAKRVAPGVRSGNLPQTDFGFFDNARLRVRWTGVDQTDDRRSLVWTGSVEGKAYGQAVMVVSGTTVAANISTGDGKMFQIRSTEDGGQWVREIDQSQFPDEGRSAVVFDTPPPAPPLAAGDAAPDDGSSIDVMVVYTPKVTSKLGGARAAQLTVQLGIAETNLGYQNSGVIQRVHLVYSGEVQYAESGKMDTDLGRLTDPTDGYIDNVHRLRDSYNADLVSLWGDFNGEACGLAWILKDPATPRPDQGFSVVDYTCATGYYSFGHEMGHNMGATHTREDNTGPGAFPYSYGYKQPNGGDTFRTVMAYKCTTGSCEPRINYWSNPAVNYHSQATGISPTSATAAANYMTLNNTRNVIANYRTGSGGGGGGGSFPESDHPYADNTDKTYTFTMPAAASLNVTFDGRTSVENGYDFLYVSDSAGNQISGSPFTGASLANRTVVVPGTTVKIRLLSDDSINDYGFKVTSITATGGGASLSKLVVTSLTAPTTATIGTNLTGVAVSFTNQGTAAAGAFRLGYYYSRNRNVTAADIFSGWFCTYSNGLAVGATSSCNGEVGVPPALGPGVWYIAAIADDQNTVAQSDRSGNVRVADSGTITIGGGTAAELLQPVAGAVLTSATVTFRWSSGTGVSGYTLAIGTSGGGTDIYNRDQGTALSVAITGLPTNGASLYIRLTSRIGNGAVSREYTVAALNLPQGGNLPKLVLTAFSAPASGQVGVNLHNMSVTIVNQGTANAGPFRIGFYFGRNSTVTKSDTWSGWSCTYAEGLNAGFTNTCSGDLGVPSTLQNGRWYLAAIADDQGNLRQSDSSGSIRMSDNGPVTITGNSLANMLSPAPGSTLASSSVAFRWDAGSGAEQYYLDIGTAAGENDLVHADQGLNLSTTINGLPTDGRTLYVRLWTRFGANWQANDYTYRAFRAAVGSAAPQIVVTSFRAPKVGTIGANLQGTRVVVTNQGNANAGPFRVGYYYGTSANVTTADVFSGWFCTLANGLTVGSTFTCSGDIGVPASLIAGQWYVAVIADDLAQLRQVDRSGSVRAADTGPVTLSGGNGGGGALPESPHPYPDNTDRSWTYTAPGNPLAIKVTFDAATSVEAGYDFIYIYDGTGAQIPFSPFTGQDLADQTVVVPGSTVRIRLMSDESVNDYGFKVTSITDAGALPKLGVTSFTAPTSGRAGVNLQNTRAVVANQGPAAAGAFRFAFYYGRSPNVSTNDVFSGWYCTLDNGLAAGATYACSGEIGVPASVGVGTWYVAAIADDLYAVDQSDRRGNVRVNDNGPTALGSVASLGDQTSRSEEGLNVSGVTQSRH